MKFSRAVWFYIVAFVCLSVQWFTFAKGIDVQYRNLLGTLLKVAGDVSLILLPYWFIRPKYRWSTIVPIAAFSLIFIINTAYYRFWGELISPAAVLMGGNIDANLMRAGMTLLNIGDILYFIPVILMLAALILIRPDKSGSFSGKGKLITACCTILIGVAGQASYFKTVYGWNSSFGKQSLKEAFNTYISDKTTSAINLYIKNGLLYYTIQWHANIVNILNNKVTLSEDQIAEITDFIRNYESTAGEPAHGVNGSTNVVYIIVESLNADMIDREINSLKVMPTLDSLLHCTGTVLCDNVVSQIKHSNSSDGHLLLMTGLLPPDDVSYSLIYGSSNRFPSLADHFPRHDKYLLLADNGVYWNEANTLQNFGLGTPVTVDDRQQYSPETYGLDGAMFHQATAMLRNTSKPFFMTMMTMSMHVPFKESGWAMPTEIAEATGLTQMEKDYANTCHHFDKYLGEFINNLPSNTIVFIASDHSQNATAQNSQPASAVFMAINTGRTQHISRVVGQVNLYGAALEILGAGEIHDYKGVAPSAFSPSVDGTRDAYGKIYGHPTPGALDTLNTAFRLSDLIIRGNYFAFPAN